MAGEPETIYTPDIHVDVENECRGPVFGITLARGGGLPATLDEHYYKE